MIVHDDPAIVALLQDYGCLALGRDRPAIHNRREIPLVARPTRGAIHLDEGIQAIHAHLLHARSLLLVNGEIVRPSDNRRRPRAVHHGNVVGVVLAQLLDITELPGPQHFREHVIDLLLVAQGDERVGAVRGGSAVLLFLLVFLLRRKGKGAAHRERRCQEKIARVLDETKIAPLIASADHLELLGIACELGQEVVDLKPSQVFYGLLLRPRDRDRRRGLLHACVVLRLGPKRERNAHRHIGAESVVGMKVLETLKRHVEVRVVLTLGQRVGLLVPLHIQLGGFELRPVVQRETVQIVDGIFEWPLRGFLRKAQG